MQKKNDLLIFSTFIILIINFSFAQFPSGKIPIFFAFLLLLISMVVFYESEKNVIFDKYLSIQIALPFCYLTCFYLLINFSGYKDEIYVATMQAITSRDVILCISTATGVAVFEEIFFRKFLINFFSKLMTIRLALIASSFIFSLAHVSTLPTYFLYGYFLGWIMLKFNSIIGSVALHFMYDFFGFLSQNEALKNYRIADQLSVSEIFRVTNAFSTAILFIVITTIYVGVNFYFKIKINNPTTLSN